MSLSQKKNGLLVVLSSPAGGGKDSIIRELIKLIPNSTRTITTTTRSKRPGNVDGVDYFFVSEDVFQKKIQRGDFIEYNNLAGYFYGTEKEQQERLLSDFDIVFSQVDVNGKHSFDRLGISHLSIFLMPESLEILRQRAIKRGGMTDQMINDRLEIAKKETASAVDYDFRVINRDGKMSETVAEIKAIIDAYQNQY